MKKLAILAAAALFAVPTVGCHHCGSDWWGGNMFSANYCNECGCATTSGYNTCNSCGTGDTYAPVLPTPQTYQGQ